VLASSPLDGPALRELIKQKLDDGTLPLTRPENLYAGPGSGARCTGCGEPIYPMQIEYEFDYEGERQTLRLHLECAGLWEALRLRRDGG
jgi:hypothetical protein